MNHQVSKISREQSQVKYLSFVYYPKCTKDLPSGGQDAASVVAELLPMLNSDALELLEVLRFLGKTTFQVEEGTVEGKIHYQGMIELKERMRPNTFNRAVMQNFGGLMLSQPTEEGRVERYVTKSLTRILGPYSTEEVPFDATEWTEAKLKPWQEECERICQGPVHKRQVHVFYDKTGLAGKTFMWKRLMFRFKAMALTWMNAKDLAEVICNNHTASIYAFNFPRVRPAGVKEHDLWCTIESIKDGFIRSGKWKGQCKIMKVPHVIVFTNTLPERWFMSEDRWVIHDITN